VDDTSTNGSSSARVARFRNLEAAAALATDWDRLAGGVPFRSWAWQSHWWRHYGEARVGHDAKASLFTLGVLDRAGVLIGIAPWYLARSAAEGRVVRFLGTGEVCSDYLSVLCAPGAEETVAGALADWLTDQHRRPAANGHDRWDLLELTGVDAEDAAVGRLAHALEARHNTVHRRRGPSFWRIELPGSWDEYLATGRVAVHQVERLEDLPKAQDVLIDLHQRRRRSLGEPGCFASTRFGAFHRDVMADLLRNGQLLLRWLELDGRPIAAEYALAGEGVIYAYQSGVDPDALEHSPGQLSHVAMLRHAIAQGYRALDFLRGDEPYKPHWRARPRPSVEVRAVPPGAAARLRHGLWLAGTGVKAWIKGQKATFPFFPWPSPSNLARGNSDTPSVGK
jgi:hypothetical protein